MKKCIIIISLISFISTLYSIDKEWDEAFKKSDFNTCHTLLIKRELSHEEKEEIFLRVNVAIAEIKAHYNLMFGKTIEQDWNRSVLLLLGLTVWYYATLISPLIWYYQRLDFKDLNHSKASNTNAITWSLQLPHANLTGLYTARDQQLNVEITEKNKIIDRARMSSLILIPTALLSIWYVKKFYVKYKDSFKSLNEFCSLYVIRAYLIINRSSQTI